MSKSQSKSQSKSMSKMRHAARMMHESDDMGLKAEFDFLHRKDEDLSIKAGAVLAFSGLLIASTLVLLAAEPSTALHAPAGAVSSLVAVASTGLLFFGAALALAAVALSRVYDLDHSERLVAHYDAAVRRKYGLWRGACWFTNLGAVAAAIAYAFVIAANAFGVELGG